MILIAGSWMSLALRGAAAVLFGVLTLVWPQITLLALVLLFGVYALVDGISMLVAAFTRAGRTGGRRGLLIFEGAVGVGVGILTFVWPRITAVALLYLIAGWALITGAIEIAIAIRLRRVIETEWFLGLAGALSILFGILLIISPGAGALAITWMIALYVILFGSLLLALAFRLRKAVATSPSS
jgi:uncharacterized membrane protein HdeD (DUF308 family)